MKNNASSLSILGIVLVSVAQCASADTLYQDPVDPAERGDCLFNTACYTQTGYQDVFAAQEFTLSSGSIVTAGSFDNLTLDQTLGVNFMGATKLPTAINWIILQANGTHGLPGTVVARGADDPILSSTYVMLPGFEGDPLYQETFALPSVTLPQGTYYFALQALGSDVGVYLAQGLAPTGAAFTSDGGNTWFSGFSSITSAAIALDGTPSASGVPEPGLLGLLVLGLSALGVTQVVRWRRVLQASLTQP